MTRSTVAFSPSFTRVQYTVAEWSVACGLGETKVRDHIESGNLVPHYLDEDKGQRRTKYISLEEGLRWIRTLPRE